MDIKKRKSKHKSNYKLYLNGKYHWVTSFDIIKNDDYEAYLIKEFPCENKHELEREERK